MATACDYEGQLVDAARGVAHLAAHGKILEFAREKGREIWFDIHVWTDHPPEPAGMRPARAAPGQPCRAARPAG
jgi:hypothetical protein